jgi:SAM-dependent methyltransferase
VARIYDYLLGGKDNFASDRVAAEKLKSLIPGAAVACRQNRYFLQRVVRYLTGTASISQFIDIGSGLPTMENVHEIAQRINPSASVIYVDNDPLVLSHARALLQDGSDHVYVVNADLRYPGDILNNEDARGMIDFAQPIAVLMFAVMHFVSDDEQPGEIIRQFTDVMAPGSYLALSHITGDEVGKEESKEAVRVYEQTSAPVTPRSHHEIMRFFDGMELVPPGLMNIDEWPIEYPEYVTTTTARQLIYGGVAGLPGTAPAPRPA